MTVAKPTAKKSRTKKDDRKIRYLIKDRNGEFIIEIPSSWKVTFSSVNPSSNGMGTRDGHCVRVWEGEKLRAVFNNAERIRDLSIPLARKVTKETGSASWSFDSEGKFDETKHIEKESEFNIEDDVDSFVFNEED